MKDNLNYIENLINKTKNYNEDKFIILIEQKFSKYLNECLNAFENSSLTLRLNNNNLIYENSPLISSSANGLILESYITKQLLKFEGFVKVPQNGNPSSDIKYVCSDYSIFINIKTHKDHKFNNKGVAALTGFLDDYFLKGNYNKQNYALLNVFYNFNLTEGTYEIGNINFKFLERINYFNNKLLVDKRSWTENSNPLSARFQLPSEKNTNLLNQDIKSNFIETISSYLLSNSNNIPKKDYLKFEEVLKKINDFKKNY